MSFQLQLVTRQLGTALEEPLLTDKSHCNQSFDRFLLLSLDLSPSARKDKPSIDR